MCLECGHWFQALAGHLRAHEMTTGDYREAWGIARTMPLISIDQAEMRHAIGVRRRDTEPDLIYNLRVLGEPNRVRAAPAARGRRRESARRNVQAARRAWAAEHYRERFAALGVDGPEAAIRRARREGWTLNVLCKQLGVSSTAFRRMLEREGVEVPFLPTPATRKKVAELRAHVAAHGSIDGVSGHLSGWLASRRHLRRVEGPGPLDAVLDEIAPGWWEPRR